MAEGNVVAIFPIRAELTTREAAKLLSVSRPCLVRLLEEGTIPFHKVGSHRRVRIADLLDYIRDFETARDAALDELAAQAE
ncbi:MAG: helix-turn-helix domain-containing protein, partial [Bauldia sp.]|nr:helix-turn-helix domain-containing protein [Bauldia sp.]